MEVLKEVESSLKEIEVLEVEEIENYILKEIEKFKKTKEIKYYLKGLINNLKESSSEILNNFGDLNSKNKIKELEKFKENLKKIKVLKKIYRPYKNEKNKKIINYTEPNETIKYFKGSLENYDIKDIMHLFSKIIKTGNLENEREKILEYNEYITNVLVESLYNNNDLLLEFGYILDSLKYRINKYAENSFERNFLKTIQTKFKNIYKIYKEKKKVNASEKSYFEILKYYIYQENYFTIQEFIRRKPELCNLKHNNEHIVLYILDEYFKNMETMFKDKDGTYINLNYLKELYFLFTNSPHFRISVEDRKKIDEKLNEMNLYVKATLIKEKRKKYALNEIKQMRPNNFYMKKRIDYREITDDYMIYEKQRVLKGVISDSKRKIEEGMIPERAFIIGNVAYSIVTNNDKMNLRIHTLNISLFIQENAIILQYFHKFIRENNYPDDFILHNYKYENEQTYSVITYNLEFCINGKFNGLTVDKGVIKVDGINKTVYIENDDIKEFMTLYKRSLNKNGGILNTFDVNKINEHFDTLLNLAYIDFIRRNKIPFIYHGYMKQSDSELIENKNNLINVLNGLEKKDISDVINIITSRVDKFHYSVYPMENPVYDLKLIDNFNYTSIINQRCLNEIYFNTCRLNDEKLEKHKKTLYRKNDELVDEFNSYIGYIDMEKIKKYHGKMLVKKR